MDLALSAPPPRVSTLFRVGLAAQIALVVMIATGAYLGLLPTRVPGLPHLDLLGHAGLIGPLAFFLDGALDHRRLTPRLAFPRLAPVLVIAIAGAEEYAQRFSSRRDSSWSDFVADVVGILFFSWLSKRVGDALARRAPAARQ